MAEFIPPVKNDAGGLIIYIALNDASVPGSLKANPTLAAGDVQISKDGGAFGNLTTLPTVTPAAGRAVKVTFSQAEINADNIFIQFVDQTSPKEWTDFWYNFQTAARHIADLAFPATTGRSMVVDAAGLVDANAVKVGPTGSGTAQTAKDLGASTTQTGDSFARLGAPAGASVSVDVAAVKTDTAAIKLTTDDLVNARKTAKAMGRGTVTTGGTTTSVPTSAFLPAGAIANQFVGRTVLFDVDTTTTTLRGVAKAISASSNAANPTFTVDALPAAPATGDTFSVI